MPSKDAEKNAQEAPYDSIAESYRKSKDLEARRAIDDFSIEFYLGDLRGKSILDLGCGEGHYARRFADLGAKHVVGVDISSQMIALAKNVEESHPKGIQYFVSDASKSVVKEEEFDLVTGIFILHYAESVAKLSEFIEQIFQDLKPNGLFLGLNLNPKAINLDPHYYDAYSFSTVHTGTEDGDTIQVSLTNKDQTVVAFQSFHFSLDTYRRCFEKAGFKNIEFLPVLIDPKAVASLGWDFWLKFIQMPSTMIIKAVKSA